MVSFQYSLRYVLANWLLFSLNSAINGTLFLALTLVGIPHLSTMRIFSSIRRTPDMTPLCRLGYSLVAKSYYTRNTQLTLALQITIYLDSYKTILMENLPIIENTLKTRRFIPSSKLWQYD